jgi:hypothetical protein
MQKLRLSSNFSLQVGQYFMRELVYNEEGMKSVPSA